MKTDKNSLTPYTLKFSKENKKEIRMLLAEDEDIQFQYELFDKAIEWAESEKERLVALANPKNGSYGSYYLSESTEKLDTLQAYWNCNPTRALYTAIITYLNHVALENKVA